MNEQSTNINLENTAPNWQQDRQNNFIAQARGKQNIRLVAENTEYGSLFSKSVTNQPGRRDNVAGLTHEFNVLNRLKTTGVTPEPLLLKKNSDNTQAHLLMSTLEGNSLENQQEPSEWDKQHFNEIVLTSLQAMKKINDEGIYVVDINSGTFLINRSEEKDSVTTYVLDFELAIEKEAINDPENQSKMKNWYSKDDIGVEILQKVDSQPLEEQDLQKIEQYLTAKTVVEFFVGSDYSQERQTDLSELSPEEQEKYTVQLNELLPTISKIVNEGLAQDFEQRQQRGETLYATFEEFLEDRYENELQKRINQAMINVTLPSLLQKNNINANPQLIEHLQRAMSPILKDRPTI